MIDIRGEPKINFAWVLKGVTKDSGQTEWSHGQRSVSKKLKNTTNAQSQKQMDSTNPKLIKNVGLPYYSLMIWIQVTNETTLMSSDEAWSFKKRENMKKCQIHFSSINKKNSSKIYLSLKSWNQQIFDLFKINPWNAKLTIFDVFLIHLSNDWDLQFGSQYVNCCLI